jgi:asparagine synthase (glutamine-hydrolysing)
MCGIVGFTQYQSAPSQAEQLIEKMVHTIHHRGPDAQGTFVKGAIALGHARLSIIDLSELGAQPMHSPCGRYSLVFNGEIYNFQQIRQALASEGVSFRGHSDTEVILSLYTREGPQAVTKLNGMFAIAFWDHASGTLTLQRDRIGKKPLYYTQHKGELIFASELKALLCYPGLARGIRPDAVHDFFAYQYVPDPKTIFENIYKLPPAHTLVFQSKQEPKIQCYWKPSFANSQLTDLNQAKERLYDIIAACTRRRMISDVPLGAFLSGGIDSSAVVGLMAETGKTVTTCSIGFDDKQYNEIDFARIVAEKFGTQHHEFTVHQNVADRLEDIARYFDEPFADPSLVPTYFVSELARRKVTVALAGDGGDEIFAGYSKYGIDWRENKLRERFPTFTRKAMGQIAPLLRQLPGKVIRKACSLMHSLSLDPAQAFYVTNSFLDEHLWQALITPETRQILGDYHPSELTRQRYEEADGPDHLSKILYTDMMTYLPGGILVKVDRMSMANSLEVRAPLLDYENIEFANTLASQLKLKAGEKKYILKETFKQLLPHDILYRKKMGFSTPLASWLRGELKHLATTKLFAKNAGIYQYFQQNMVEKLWEQHQAKLFDHSSLLWSLLMFELWWQHYMT